VPTFAQILPRAKLYEVARQRVSRLKELLPPALFAVAIQARAEGRIVARETLSALKKDVTGYLYGGDRTRKMKLWARQKKGKKRLGERGEIEVPPEVFFKMLRRR
jgi:GTP-binding protein LepA